MPRTQAAAALDRDAAVPLYHQIYLQLRDEIVGGMRAYGSLVPTEQELAESFAVSRITARRALDELAADAFVARKRRVGTTVIYRSPTKPIEANIAQAVNSLVTFGRATKARVVEIVREPAQAPVAAMLGVPTDAMLVRAVRIRSLGKERLGYIVSYVPERLGFAVTKRRLESEPLLSVLQDAGCTVASAKQMIAAMTAGPVIAQALSIDPIAPILRVTRTFLDQSGQPVLMTQAHYRADRYQIRLDLQSTDMGLAPAVKLAAPDPALDA